MADASGTICKLDSKPDGAHYAENERLEDSFGSQRYGRSFVGTVRQISISPGGRRRT